MLALWNAGLTAAWPSVEESAADAFGAASVALSADAVSARNRMGRRMA